MANAEESEEDTEQSQIPPKRRTKAKNRDKCRCQTCGAKGIEAGGTAQLEVHHIESDPEHCQIHDLENLLTLCTDCHHWVHLMPEDTEKAPFKLSAADRETLLPHDICILCVLAEGPSRPSEIADEIPPDISTVSVRERLWLLAGLDNIVEERQERLVAQSSRTGKWGLAEDISSPVRGRIPEDTKNLIQRIRDERVRRALDQGIDRETVAAVFNVHRRTTYYAERRARAFMFPLDAITAGDEASDITVQSDGDSQLEQVHGNGTGQQSSDSLDRTPNVADEDPGDSIDDVVTTEMLSDLVRVLTALQARIS